ncbi:MAG: YgiQ family radical SAM protein [Candidatus Aphodosoma sp.]
MLLTDWLPTTKKELEIRGWDEVDVVFFTGDAYVDHPSFGAAVVGRVIESEGWRVAIVPQPDWRSDHRDFTKMGRPRRFFAISAGCMDSMVNHYTAGRRLRSNDAYTPDGRAGARPDRTTIVYSRILRQLFPDVPIVIGGIEASLRRLSHYDYWDDAYHRSILVDSGADLLVYGMGEKPLRELVHRLNEGQTLADCHDMPQIAYLSDCKPQSDQVIMLPSHRECASDRRVSAATFRIIEEESNKLNQTILCQPVDNKYVVVNPPFPPMTTAEIDAVYELPFTRLPHPKYKGKTIPAFDMIRWSVNTHRGCWGGCAFCTISMHQGKFVVSRSKESILREVRILAADPDFKGYLSDLGGPSANMYMMRGRDESVCMHCHRPSCAFPSICKNMNVDHRPLLDVYHAVDGLPYIKKSFIGSGVRYDVAMADVGSGYSEELIAHHVSGRLKVAPEHTSDRVLRYMRKPPFGLFHQFKRIFDDVNRREGLNQQIIPYFISSHPGCEPIDMAQLAVETKRLNFQLEQVQDFTPTPMTLATEMYHSGYDPYTMKPVFVARTQNAKTDQRRFFFWYKPEERAAIKRSLVSLGRPDLIEALFGYHRNSDISESVPHRDPLMTRKQSGYRSYETERKLFFERTRHRKRR